MREDHIGTASNQFVMTPWNKDYIESSTFRNPASIEDFVQANNLDENDSCQPQKFSSQQLYLEDIAEKQTQLLVNHQNEVLE